MENARNSTAASTDTPIEPLVSVIVPVYNKVQNIDALMRCVLSQDASPLEMVCVDDRSNDGSLELLQRYAALDSRVKLVRHECNRGPGAARNTGLEHAKGRFVTFLDADDVYGDDSFLRRLCEGAMENGVMAAGASLCNVRAPYFTDVDFSDNPEFSGYTFRESGVVSYEDYQFDYGFHRFVYARSLLEEGAIRFDGRRFFEDPPFLVRALHRAGSFYADARGRYLYLVGYRAPSWSTDKVIDLLEGVRLDLSFALENDLAKLYWITVRHLEWESYPVPLGVDPALDAHAISEKLGEVEALIDRELLGYLDPDCENFTPLLRTRLNMMQGSGSLGRAAAVEYRIRSSRPWHHVRVLRDKHLRGRVPFF